MAESPFESELLDLAQLTAACRAWAADKSKPLAGRLIERGWITGDARGFVEFKRDYRDRCKTEWDQLWKKVAPPP